MRYLKTYEDWMVPTDINLDELIQKYNPDFKWSDTPIWRGDSYNDNPIYITTKENLDPRKSANTTNYSTYLFDNSPYTKDYPKRSRSAICSSSYDDARTYAGYPYDQSVYRVIPFKDTKIGVCGADDFWWSFPNITNKFNVSSISSFNDLLNNTFGIFNKSDLDDNSEELFFKDINKMLKQIDKTPEKILYKKIEKKLGKQYDFQIKKLYDQIRKLPKTLNGLYHLYDPKSNGLRLANNYKEFTSMDIIDTKEIWVDAGHILVRKDIIDKF